MTPPVVKVFLIDRKMKNRQCD